MTSKTPRVPGEALLHLRGIEKRFAGEHALRGVDLEVHAGEVHALVGENGAGKSTLMHILAGVHQPDGGTIEFAGVSDVEVPSEQAAQSLGVAIVYQERSLVGVLDAAENIFAGRQPVGRWGAIDRRRLYADASAILDELRLPIDPRCLVEDLSPHQQQMVEIGKALSLDARLLILDEPTAALTAAETDTLFALIGRIKSRGVGVIYISHRLEEIFEIADRVTVLKDGARQGTFDVAEMTVERLVPLMVGRELLAQRERDNPANPTARIALEARNVSDGGRVKDVSLQVRAGEIVGLAGLAGAGRTEFALTLFGVKALTHGEFRIDGVPARITSPRQAIKAGIGHVPEDRRESGLFLEMSVADNIAAANLRRFGSVWLSDYRLRRVADEFRARLNIATPDVDRPVGELSGGNQQKVVIARWLLLQPRILVVDEPTRGIDVAAKAEVHALLQQLASSGTAILMVSSDLPEVLAVSDRIIVMREGRVAGELNRAEATEAELMRYASTTTMATRAG